LPNHKYGSPATEQIPTFDENTILILQAGNVCTGSFDFFDEICDTAEKAKSWIHIDGAFGLWASGSDKLKHWCGGAQYNNRKVIRVSIRFTIPCKITSKWV
jgi:hypothetical protein